MKWKSREETEVKDEQEGEEEEMEDNESGERG